MRRTTLFFICFLLLPSLNVQAEGETEETTKKMNLYLKQQALTQIPWYYYAAINQYENNIHDSDNIIAMQFDEMTWYGPLNKDKHSHPTVIEIFGGIGKDGNGDQKAEEQNPEDLLTTLSDYLLQYGKTEQDIKIALWNYYQRELTVQTIMNIAKVYKEMNQIDNFKQAFPVPKGYNNSYNNTWGDKRGFGGRRIHEGTDIFANYGTPVRATNTGVVELKGWNKFGGWRIGIRDVFNRYHYYAHLNHFTDGINVGDIVKAGEVIGTVGSSGYGPPGTSGKFPPHLHYGIYKDDGKNEWAFDPYPYLKIWQRNAVD